MNPTVMSPTPSEGSYKLAAPISNNGRDFVSWQHQLTSWFLENNLWQYVIGFIDEIEEPDFQTISKADAKKYFDWQAKNCQAKNMIFKCLHPRYRVLIQDFNTVEQCWKGLENYFMKDSMILQQQLQDEFDDYKLDYSKSMEDNLMLYSTLLSRLKYIKIQHSEQKQCHKLLQALPKSYSNMKTVIKFSNTKYNTISLSELYERIEDYARERGHWETPIRKSENILNINIKENNNNFKKYNKNQNQNYNNYSKNKTKFKQNKQLKCTLCQGDHQWFKCRFKDKITEFGKKLRNEQKVNIAEEKESTSNEEDVFVLNTTNDTSLNDSIVLDSGCSILICNDKNHFSNIKRIPKISLKNFLANSPYDCELGGTATLKFIDENKNIVSLKFEDALYVPRSRYTLLPPSILNDKHGYKTSLCNNTVKLSHINKPSIIGFRQNNIYKIPILKSSNFNAIENDINHVLDEENKIETANKLLKLWHYKLGHLSYNTLKKMARNKLIPSILASATADDFCDSCNKGKQFRKPFPKQSFNRATYPNERIIFDLLVLNKRCVHNHKYVLGGVDDYSSYDSAYMLKTKDEAAINIKSHILKMEKLIGRPVSIVRFDRGGEFMSTVLQEWLKNKGIKVELTVAKSSPQIGKRERLWRTNMNMTRCLLYQSSLSKNLWCYAYQYAVDIRNRVIGSHRSEKSPLTKMFKIIPNLSGLKVFGCPVSVKDHDTKKLDFKSHDMLFIGFSKESKGILCYNPIDKSVLVRRDVIFDETFTISSIETKRDLNLNMKSLTAMNNDNDDENIDTDESDNPDENSTIPKNHKNLDNIIEKVTTPNIPFEFKSDPYNNTIINQEKSLNNLNTNKNQERSLKDLNNNNNEYININEEPNTNLRRSSRIKNPTQRFIHEVYYNNIDLNSIKASTIQTPRNINEALNSNNKNEWKNACDQEINSLIKRKVFEVVNKPNNNKRLIRCQWIFRVKPDNKGNIDKFKARLVANGNEQDSTDLLKISSPVLHSTTLLLLLTIATKLNWKLHSIDVKTAYLNAKLDESVFMYLPPGYFNNERKENKVALLKKSLYGLKQSAKLWNLELSKTLKNFGFYQLKLDPCVYYKYDFIIGIYVDDLLLISKSEESILKFKEKFKKIYDITDNHELTSILGTKLIKKDDNTIVLQDTYIEKILTKFNYNNIKGKTTPMESKLSITNSEEPINYSIQKDFQEKIGSLLYVMVRSRPDISYSVSKLTQFCVNPNEQHLKYAKRIFSYLKTTINEGIKIDSMKEFQLKAYVDASFADDLKERKSTSGFILFMDNTPVFWRTKKQGMVAKSTMEAELIALESIISEIIWVRNLLDEMNFKQNCTSIFCDNTAAIQFATDQRLNSRNKHIDIRKCFIKQHIDQKNIKLIYIESENNIADMFTKFLSKNIFNYFKEKMNMVNIKKECWNI